MSSLYRRKNSPFWWANIMDPVAGKRVNVSTRVRAGTSSDYRKALAFLDSKDRASTGIRTDESHWNSWVPLFIQTRYATSPRSLERIEISWRNIHLFLAENKITHPIQVTRNHCLAFLQWRKKAGMFKGTKGKMVCHNTALYDLKTFRMFLNEALDRRMIAINPAARLLIQKEPPAEKDEATDEQIAIIRARIQEKIEAGKRYTSSRHSEVAHFLYTSFEIAFHQGVRLAETHFPLSAVNYRDAYIRLHAKGNKFFDAPINPQLRPLLERLRDEGRKFTYEKEARASLLWFNFFNELRRDDPSFNKVSFHSLRVGGISRFARAGIPEPIVMKMVGHCSTTVHRRYRRAPVSELNSYWGAVAAASLPLPAGNPSPSKIPGPTKP